MESLFDIPEFKMFSRVIEGKQGRKGYIDAIVKKDESFRYRVRLMAGGYQWADGRDLRMDMGEKSPKKI